MTGKALKNSGFVAATALLLCLVALSRQGREVAAPAPPKPEPGVVRIAAVPPGAAAVVPVVTPATPPRRIRYVFPGGTSITFEESSSTQQERIDWANTGKAQFVAAMAKFEADYRRILKTDGASVAVGLLERELDTTSMEIPILAGRNASLKLLAEIQRELLAQNPAYTAVGSTATGLLLRVLEGPQEHRGDRDRALSYLGGLQLQVSCAGRIGRVIDGVDTYDLSEPVTMILGVEPPQIEPYTALDFEKSFPSLGNSEVDRVVFRIASDPSLTGYTRSLALRALASRPELLEALDLGALALNPPEDLEVAIVWALSRRPDKLASVPFSALVGAQADFDARALVWKTCSQKAFEERQISGLVDRALPLTSPPAPSAASGEGLLGRTILLDDRSYEEARYRECVLGVVLLRYKEYRDPALFEVLSRRLRAWSTWEKGEETSYTPAQEVLEHVFEYRWNEFAPLLRSLRDGVRHPGIDAVLKQALDRFEGREKEE